MSEQYIFTISRLNKHYDKKHVLKDIGLSFFHGAKIGIVGENGAGKSTLLKIMALEDKDFDGRADPAPDIRVSFVKQEPELEVDKTVRENLELAFADVLGMVKEYEEIGEKMGEMDPDEMEKAMERMGVLQDEIESSGGWEVDTRLKMAVDALVLPPDDVIVSQLSGGERRRVALAKTLLEQPDLLLLDEPTNHLDAETVEWLEGQLRDYPGTVIISTHDRYFLDNVTKWILELDHGEGVPFQGNYTSWLEQKLQRIDAKTSAENKGKNPRRRSLERELEWINMSGADRRELNQSRIRDYESAFVEETGRDGGGEDIQIAPGPHLGEDVLKLKGITKGYAGTTLIDDLSLDLPKGAVVGIVGPNGTGKTTLFRMIVGQETPDAGTVELGSTVELAYVDQHRDALDDDKTVFEEITQEATEIKIGKRTINARAYVSRFNFKAGDQQKRVDQLSGGERNRVHLAKLLKTGGNLVLLDEPTNDLDVGTLRLLEDAIQGFSGCVMVISHDRFFLNRICTHLLVFEGEGKVRWFEGTWSDYEAWLRKEKGEVGKDRRARYHRLPLLKK